MTYIKIHIKIQTIIFSFILPLLPIYYKNSMHLDTNLSTTIDTCRPTSDHDQHFLFPNSGEITEKAENSREYRLRCTRWYNPFGRFVVQQVIRFVRSPSCSIPAGNRERFVLEPRLSERVAGMMRREQTRKNHVDETREPRCVNREWGGARQHRWIDAESFESSLRLRQKTSRPIDRINRNHLKMGKYWKRGMKTHVGWDFFVLFINYEWQYVEGQWNRRNYFYFFPTKLT